MKPRPLAGLGGALCHDCLMLLRLAALELGMENTLDMAGLA